MLRSRVSGSAWMMAASMETMLELWASSLRDVKARIRPLFTPSARRRVGGLVPGRAARAGAAQDRVDAGRSGG